MKLADLSFLTGSKRLKLTSLRRYFSVFGWYYKDSRIFRLRGSKFSRTQDNNALVQCKVSFSAMQSLIQCNAKSNVTILLSLRTPALRPLTPFFNETGTAHLIAPSGFKV